MNAYKLPLSLIIQYEQIIEEDEIEKKEIVIYSKNSFDIFQLINEYFKI